ncbi:MAG TPA: Wzz/FepE/Etk N-terminal domain-containing protein [Ornithinibacter sp.]|nr:Wzz/FepE/Etk N-terminal domain-containing protein [Ornithinibacter sp.]
MTDVLTVGALGSMLLTRWKLIVAFVVLGVGAGMAYGMLSPASYTSKAVLFVIATPADKDGYYQAAQFAEKRAATYPALLSAPEVLDRTRTALDLDLPASALIPMLTATNPTDSPLVEVAATAGTPVLAKELAGTAAQYLADYAVDLEESGTNVGAVRITMAVPAREPQYPSSPSPLVLGALGGLAGGALGVIAALLTNAWKRRPRSAGDGKAPAAVPAASGGAPDSSAAGHSGHATTTGGAPAAGHTAPTPSAAPADDEHANRQRASVGGPAGPPPQAPVDAPVSTEPGGSPRPTGSATGTMVSGTPARKRKRRRAHAPAGPARVDAVRAVATGGAPVFDDSAAPSDDHTPAPAADVTRADDGADGNQGPAPQDVRPAPSNGQPATGGAPPARGGPPVSGLGAPAPRKGSLVGRLRTSARGR